MDITYTLSVTVTRPVRINDYEDPLQVCADWMVSAESKRELEKEVLRALRVLDGDCDVEVMETECVGALEPEAEPEPSRTLTRQERLQGLADSGCDTWEEYRGER